MEIEYLGSVVPRGRSIKRIIDNEKKEKQKEVEKIEIQKKIERTNALSLSGEELGNVGLSSVRGVFIPSTDEEQKIWFQTLIKEIEKNPAKIKILIHPEDALTMLRRFVEIFENKNARLTMAKDWAQAEEKMPDSYFWKMVLWYYRGEVKFTDVINDNYIKVAKELELEPELIDSSLTNPEGLGAFNPIFHERKNVILWFCDAGHFTGGNEWKGRTFVKLSAYGETANNRFKVGRKIKLVNTVNNYYDGEYEVQDWIAKSDRGIDGFNKALGRYKITGFCINKTPLKEGYHGGFFPDMTNVSWNLWYEAKDKAGYWMPKHLGQESEHRVGSWSHSGKAIVDHFRNKSEVLQISKLVIPPSEKLTFKNLIWALPREAFRTLVSEFNFANIGTRYIVGEVGFEVAEQAGISYNDWAKAARWKNGSTKKIIDFWTKTASGRYDELQSAAWENKGAKRKSLIAKLKKHPNFNYYRHMNHQTNQVSGSYPQPPQSPKLSGIGIGLGQLQSITTAPEFYNTELFDYDENMKGLGAVTEGTLATISSTIIVPILGALGGPAVVALINKSLGTEMPKECTDAAGKIVGGFVGDSQTEIEENPNYNNATKCGMNLIAGLGKAVSDPQFNPQPPKIQAPPIPYYQPPSLSPPPTTPKQQNPGNTTTPVQQKNSNNLLYGVLGLAGASAIGILLRHTYLLSNDDSVDKGSLSQGRKKSRTGKSRRK